MHLTTFEKKYESAIELIHEGIIISQKEGYSGTVNDWKDMLLEVYQKMGNTKELRNTAFDLYFCAHDSMKFYNCFGHLSGTIKNSQMQKLLVF